MHGMRYPAQKEEERLGANILDDKHFNIFDLNFYTGYGYGGAQNVL